MKTMLISRRGKEFEGTISYHRYENGNLEVLLNDADGERVACLSADIDGVDLEDDEFVAKTYTENRGLVDQFIDAGTFVRTGVEVPVGIAPLQPVLKAPFVFSGWDR